MDTALQAHKPPRPRGPRLLLIAVLAIALALQLAPAQVALAAGNDTLASATLITPPLTNDATNTTTATRDTGEIGGGGGTCNFPPSGNTHSVWYKYTPASNGFLAVDTFTSNYDTVLEVFSGSVALANSIACNDDSGGTSQSALTFQATSGTTYYIVIRSFGATAGGTLKFSASFSAQHNLYVNQTTGISTNPGTAARPVKTIQQGVNLAFPSGSIINIVTLGVFAEAVTIAKNLTLKPTAGAVTANSFTLASGAIITLAGSPITISAPTITVQAGARIPDGVALASIGGTVSVGNGTFTQNVTVAKSLTLRAINEGAAAIQPASGNAVTLSGGTVTLRGFTISAAGGTGVNITGGTGHTILRNNITGNTSGVVNATASAVNAAQNFWGAANGPTHPSNPGGTGNRISNNVTYRPWCTTAVPTCNPQAGIATRLVFNPSPSDSQASVAFLPPPVVEAQDNFGNIDTSYSGNVTLAIATNPGGGALAGTPTVAVVNGKATFSGLSINKVGVGYTLQATSGSLIAGTSAPFTITVGLPSKLVFAPSPGNSTAGVAFPIQPVVEVQDAGGNLVTSYSGSITLTIGINPSGGTLAGTVTVPVSGGKATFSGLSIDKSGVGYTLQASSGSLTGTSTAFNIDAGPPTQLFFKTSPSNSTGGMPFPIQPVVEVQDAGGNVVISYSGSISLTIGTNPSLGALAGTTTVTVVNGKATFSGLSIDKAGTGYTLVASSGALSQDTSFAFDIGVGTAAKLTFNPPPLSNSVATVAFVPPPVVEVQDAGGNLVTSYTGSITLTIGTNPGGGTLAGIVTQPVSGGQASFSGLSINKVGTGYTLQATSGSLTAATSNPFNITVGGATKLFFNPSPNDSQATVAFVPPPVVEVQDAGGNLVTTYSGSITLTIGTNPSAGVLAGVTTVAISGGQATFSGLSIDKVGVGYTLQATSIPLTPDTSDPFNITKTTATVTLSNLNVTYDGNQHGATATTNPISLTVVLTYTGTTVTYGPTQTPPTNAGSYAVVATINDPDYQGSATGTLIINKATATVTLSNLIFTYDGNQHGATVTTNPISLAFSITYNGSPNVPTNAGSYAVVATITNSNYQGSATATLTINKAPATITLSSLNHIYDGNPHPAITTTSPASLAVSLTYNGSPTVPVNAGSYAVVAAITNPNYQGSTTGTLVIAKASQTITFAALANKAYGDPPFTISASASSGLTVIFSATGQCTVAGNTVTLTSAGSCTITASQPGNTNYSAALAVQRTFTIAKGNQTINFAPLQDRALTNSPFTISASASSGLAVSFSAAGQCTVTGSNVTLTGLGSCTITANQAGNANYNPAQPVARTFTIVNSFTVFLPLIMDAPAPDLVGSFTLTPNSVAPNSPVLITVTITNAGTVAAGQFWVDFYINPSTPPTDTNQPWNKRCQLSPCYGIAWYITGTIEPGQSITLTATRGSYFGPNTRWGGQFAQGTSDLYLYVDSWNPGVATGAVPESNETNNRAEYHAQPASAAAEPSPNERRLPGDLPRPGAPPRPDDLPPRPVRP